ncbi:MAG TPA: PAS domain S-box protein [Allocoleopsis sp.]
MNLHLGDDKEQKMLNVLSPQIRRYAVAGLVVALALPIELLLKLQFNVDNPFLLFLPVVLWSSCYGGLGSGLLATVATTLLSYYCLVDPDYSLLLSDLRQTLESETTVGNTLSWQLLPGQTFQLGLFALEGVLLSWFTNVSLLVKQNFELSGEAGNEGCEQQRKTRSLSTTAQSEQLTNILESITDAFWAVDSNWRFTYINRRGEQLLQTDRAELLGKGMWEVYPQAIGSTFYHQYHTAASKRVPVQFEEFCSDLNLWLGVRVYPANEGLCVYAQDITERKRGEEALRYLAETSNFLATSLDYEATLERVAQLPVPFMADWCSVELLQSDGSIRRICVAHADPAKVEYALQLAQYPPDLEGLNPIAKVLRTGRAEVIPELSDSLLDASTHDAEHLKLIRELGFRSAAIVPMAIGGQILGTITLVTAESGRRYDVTDLALAEDLARRAALAIDNARLYQRTQQVLQRQSELLSLLDALLAAAPVGICFLDKELRYIHINQVLASINGFSIEEHLGRRYRDVLPEMAAQFEPQLQHVLDTGEPMLNVDISGEAPGQPGYHGHWLGNYYPVRNTDGQTVGLGVILADITETKQAEAAAREANRKVVNILESITDAFFALDSKWQFTYVNHRCAELMQSVPEHLLGRSFWEMFPTARGTILDEQYHKVIEHQTPAHFEVTGLFTGRWFEVHSYPSAEGIAVYFQEISDRKRAEVALRESEERLRAIVQNMPVMMDAFDADNHIIVWNRECERVTGYSAEEIIGNPRAIELLYPDRAYRDRMFAEHEARGLNYRDWEWEITCKDGSVKTIAWSNISEEYPIPDWGTWGIGVDVTERKQAQEALQDSEARFRVMFNQAAVGIALVALDGQFIQVNPAVCNITGYSQDELLALTIQAISHPEEQQIDADSFQRVVAREIDGYSVEKRYFRKDGSIVWVNVTVSAVWDSNNQIKYGIGIIEDISDRQAALRERKRAEEVQQFLVEASTELAASLDYKTTLNNVAHLAVPTFADWCIVDVFQLDASVRQIAIACADPVKQEILEELRRRYPPDPKRPNPAWQKLLSGQSLLYEQFTDSQIAATAQDEEHLQLLRGLGNRSVMVVPIQSRHQVLGVLSFVSSESKRRYNQADLALAEDIARRAASAIDNARLYRDSEAARTAAQEANRMKDEFLAVLSHELRSPLNAILGWTQMLRTRQLSETAMARALETIERNAKLQTQLIEDLLDVSRIIQGKLRLNIRPINIASAIDAALNTVRPAADAKGIHLTVTPNSSVGLIPGDAERLQQVVWNLVSNAIKFTPTGGRVEIRLKSTDSYTQIEVADTGKGISPDFLPHVFERFRQADSTTTRAYGGLGLGLAIVRHLVELHGGTVRADSPGEGQGATFTVKLPLQVREENWELGMGSQVKAEDSPRSTVYSSLPLKGLRVLVVDDEVDTRDYLTAVLAEYGAQATGVASVSEAIFAIAQLPPDILVSDISMPGEDGYSLIRQVRALESQAASIPAVAITAHAMEEDRKNAIAAGFNQHIPKPIEPTQLVAVVANLARQYLLDIDVGSTELKSKE